MAVGAEPGAGRDTQTPRVAPELRRLRRVGLALDGLIALGVLVLVGFPVAARLSADREPVAPRAAVALAPLPARGPGGSVRELPVLGRTAAGRLAGPPTSAAALRSAIRPAARALLGAAAGRRLAALATAAALHPVSETLVGGGLTRRAPYPYRYPALERLLRQLPPRLDAGRVAAASDLGALLTLAAALPTHAYPPPFANAAPAAFAVLDRARRGGDCAAQLNLALLLAADDRPRDGDIARELRRAARACPRDPTPLWMLAEYWSQRALPADNDRPGDQLPFPEARRAAFATAHQLQLAFPRSAAGWSAEANVELRLAYQDPGVQPFTARRRWRTALALYRRAEALQPDAGLAAGAARAEAALGAPAAAIRDERRALARAPGSAPLQARLVEYLEDAHGFGPAAAAATHLLAGGGFPDGPGLMPSVLPGPNDHGLGDEDAFGPVSLGLDRLRPLSVTLQPQGGGAGASVSDLSFIPVFRPIVGVTGSERWCPSWARRRDLLLAGRPRAALAGFPSVFHDIRPDQPGTECRASSQGWLLAAVAALQAGDRPGALGWAGHGFGTVAERWATIQDARQDLWRWAGDLPRASAAARQWAAAAPADPIPLERAGEIQFLRHRYDAAVDDFAAAARRARDQAGAWSLNEANALLKQGAALALSGRRPQALRSLDAADDVASRARALTRRQSGAETADPEPLMQLAYASYYARAQAGDIELQAHGYRAAAEHYAAAREREPELVDATHVARPAGLDDNEALVDVFLGRPARAAATAGRAVARDPANPVFMLTAAFAEQRRGRPLAAERLDRAALAADPTLYPAANDLGVLLARQGHDDDAVAALRRAVGANRGYALGWFNLGVVLGRMGPARLLASQGALGRAFALDASLRERERRPTFDERGYVTRLDLSKPLPPHWSFARSQSRAPAAAAGLTAILLLGLALARSTVAAQASARDLAGRWLEVAERLAGRIPGAGRLRPPAVAVAVTLAVFLLPLARGPGDGAVVALAFALGLLVLVGVVVRGRRLVGRRVGAPATQESWPPGLAFGLGAAVAGLAWAPLPFVRSRARRADVHWIGPVATGLIALVLLVLAAWVDVPLTRALGAAALVMCASLLTPVEPLDGAKVAARGAAAASLAVLGLALLLLLGVV